MLNKDLTSRFNSNKSLTSRDFMYNCTEILLETVKFGKNEISPSFFLRPKNLNGNFPNVSYFLIILFKKWKSPSEKAPWSQ